MEIRDILIRIVKKCYRIISGNSNGGLTNFVKTREREGLKQCNISTKVLRYL